MDEKPEEWPVVTSQSDDRRSPAVTVSLAESTSNSGGRMKLTVPGRPDAVRVVRSVMRSWAANVGFLLDEIEELCLAIDEAFSGLIATEPIPSRVTITIQSEGSGVEISASRDADTDLWPPVSAQTALIQRVLETLIDEVRFERTPDGPTIRLVKRRSDSVRQTK
jgi:anti-sigma regulatory factor (Ser/Thr protein kinase)